MQSVKTMLSSPTYGKFYFDGVFSVEHTSSVTVTEHPVQVGAPISDHAYQEPHEVSLEIGMSDAMTGVGSDHSVNAYNTLRAIMAKREPVKLVTRLWTYPNMVMTSLSAPDDKATMYGLKATVTFQSVEIVSVSTVQVQQTVSGSKTAATSSTSASSKSSSTSKKSSSKTSSAKTSTTTKTTKSTTTTKTSVLKQISQKLAG